MTIDVRSTIGCSAGNIRELLSTNGYARIRSGQLAMSENLKAGFDDVRQVAKFLPVDKTCVGAFRFRQYGRLIALPWAESFEPVPSQWDDTARARVLEYNQPASLNPEDGDRRRRFSAFERQMYANPFLRELIRFDLGSVPFSESELSEPIQVGIHLLKLIARPGSPAVVSPNLVHRDGEHYTWAHLIERIDAEGGRNLVTDPVYAGSKIDDVPRSAIRAEFTLDTPLDSYVVKDDLVAHAVDALTVRQGAEQGIRTILLIDFTPMRAILMLQPAKTQSRERLSEPKIADYEANGIGLSY